MSFLIRIDVIVSHVLGKVERVVELVLRMLHPTYHQPGAPSLPVESESCVRHLSHIQRLMPAGAFHNMR